MDNVCFRIRFSPFMKDITKTSSNFCLEIVPLVSRIDNFDKITWKQKKDRIEYVVPMNYKIIIKKLKPNDSNIKTYYSCVDLLPSSLSNVDLASGEIYRVISENYILRRERNFIAPINISPIDIKLNQSTNHEKSSKKIVANERNTNLSHNVSNSLLIRNMSVKQNTSDTEKGEADKVTPTKEIVNSLNDDRNVSDYDELTIKQTKPVCKFTPSKFIKNMSKLPLQENNEQINANDVALLENIRVKAGTGSIGCLLNELDNLKLYNMNIRKTLCPCFKNNSTDEVLISNIRIQPELRVAKFVEIMEKEILPLKVTLNNILTKCSSLGLNKKMLMDNDWLLGTNLLKRHIEKEKTFNRVVYSIVFDE